MCMIMVGRVEDKQDSLVRVNVDGLIKEFESKLELEAGDMVMLSGSRLVKKLEVVQ